MAEAAQQLLQILIALDEIDLRSVYDQKVRAFIAKEKMLVSAGDSLEIFGGNPLFRRVAFLGDALAQDLGLGLQVDDEVGRGNGGRKDVEIAFVELQLFVVEIDVGEDLVLLEKEIADDGRGGLLRMDAGKAAMAFVEKIHLSAEGRARFLVVEIGEEWIFFAIEDAAGVKAFGQDRGQRGLADADRPFDNDMPGRLERGDVHQRGIITEAFGKPRRAKILWL